MKTYPPSRRGSIMVTVLFMLSIMALLVAAVANDSLQSMKTVSQSGRDTQAKYAAYAGLELALNELRQDEFYLGEEKLSSRHGRLVGLMVDVDKLRYEVHLWNNVKKRDGAGKLPDGGGDSIPGPDAIVVMPDTVYLVSSGHDVERGEEVLLSSMSGVARRVRPVFDDAAYASTKLALTGEFSEVDAWDSAGGMRGNREYSSFNVEDYQATVGTDSKSGRTLRLLDDTKLNGHYRIGPGVEAKFAYGDDRGFGDGFFVSTSEHDNNIMGVEPVDKDGKPIGDGKPGDEKFVLDTKTTEVPHFISPINDKDVQPAPVLSGKRTKIRDEFGDPVLDEKGNETYTTEPTDLEPGGYRSVVVKRWQTLKLTSGVYYFKDGMDITGGTLTVSGDGPVIVFVGKEANFVNSKINPDGSTSALQFCFTDGNKDEAELDKITSEIRSAFVGSGLDSEQIKNTLSGTDRQGFSSLKMSENSSFSGSISGKNLVAQVDGSEIFGSVMGSVIKGHNAKIHQDLALKGSNLMVAGGWLIEDVHQIR